MAINEQIATGRKFRKLANETTKLWQRMSFWKKASDIEPESVKLSQKVMGIGISL